MTEDKTNGAAANSGHSEVRLGIDPSPEEMRRLGYLAIDWLVEHWSGLSELPVANLQATDVVRADLAEPLPMSPTPFEESLGFVQERVVSKMTQVTHPRFHAYIPTPGSFYGTLGMLLTGGLNPFVGSSLGGASFSALELETLRWVAESVGYARDADGIFTSGGSMANLGALAAARATLPSSDQPSSDQPSSDQSRSDQSRSDGVRAKALVYVSSQGHASMEKAARVLGFEDSQIRYLATDADLRIDVAAAQQTFANDRSAGLTPLFVCANAGTTNTGVVDPLLELAQAAREADVWFHVDGAYGGFAALSPAARPLLAGLELADSLTLDPHKWLYTPMGHGCLLVRRPGALAAAFAASGEYLRDVSREEVNFFDRGAELSRPTRALPVWLLMRSVGVDALRREIEADLALAEMAEDLLRTAPEFEVISRHLSVVVFRVAAQDGESEQERAQRDLDLVQHLLKGGDVLVSGTTLGGRSALRLVVMNHRTDAAQVRRSIAALRAAVAANPKLAGDQSA